MRCRRRVLGWVLLPLLSACSGSGKGSDPGSCEEPIEASLERVGGVLVLTAGEETLRPEGGDLHLQTEALARRVLPAVEGPVDQLAVWATFRPANKRGGAFFAPVGSECDARFAGMAVMGQWNRDAPRPLRLLAEEFSHQWLVDARFVDPQSGEVSDELLGRDREHWSTLVDTGGSFQDGLDWRRLEDGRFIKTAEQVRWSPVDLWYMGLADASEVPPFVLLRDAQIESTGQPVGRESSVHWNAQVTASPVELTTEALAAATPPPARRDEELRQIFVLVARPEDARSTVEEMASEIESFRSFWTDWVQKKLWCRVPLCTDPDGLCPAPCELQCGDGSCGGPETAASCPADCPQELRDCRYACSLLGPACELAPTRSVLCWDACRTDGDQRVQQFDECVAEVGTDSCAPSCLEGFFPE